MLFEIKHPFKDLTEINKLITNFKVETEIGINKNQNGIQYYNQYKKQEVSLSTELVTNMIEIVRTLIDVDVIDFCYTRINLVESNTNINDEYHTDFGYDLILTYYPTENYIGGEFEYLMNGVNYKLKPKKDSLIVMLDNPPHRVCNVISGNRYSIVTFCKTNRKRNNKLL